MKTKFYYYISILFLCLCHVSCEDFLEETNKSGLTTDPFMKTKVGIESALNSVIRVQGHFMVRKMVLV